MKGRCPVGTRDVRTASHSRAKVSAQAAAVPLRAGQLVHGVENVEESPGSHRRPGVDRDDPDAGAAAVDRRRTAPAAEESRCAAAGRRRRRDQGVRHHRSDPGRRGRPGIARHVTRPRSAPLTCSTRSRRTPRISPPARRPHSPPHALRDERRPAVHPLRERRRQPAPFLWRARSRRRRAAARPVARTRARDDRPVLRPVVSVHERARLLPDGAAAVRRLQPALLPAQHHPDARGRAARHDHQRPARRPAQPPQSAAVAAGDVRGDLRRRHRQHARLGGRHRLPARRRARAVFEQALAHHADRDDQRAADADRADAVALRRQLVVVPGEPFGRRVRDLRDRLLRLRQHAQVAGRSAGARRSGALARRDRRACARRWSAPKPPRPQNRRMVERIRMANDAGGLSVWEWDIKEDITRIDENSPFLERLGAPREFRGTEYTREVRAPGRSRGLGRALHEGAHRQATSCSRTATARCSSTAPSATSSVTRACCATPRATRCSVLGIDWDATDEELAKQEIARQSARPARGAGALPARRVRHAGRVVRVQSAHRRDLVLAALPPDARLRGDRQRRRRQDRDVHPSRRRRDRRQGDGRSPDVRPAVRRRVPPAQARRRMAVGALARLGRARHRGPAAVAGRLDPRHHRRARRHARRWCMATAGSRRGEPRQEHVPRHHEPRDPHADERHHRHDRPAARHRPRPRAARLRRNDPRQRRLAADDPQRHSRLLEDRSRQARHRAPRARPALERRRRRLDHGVPGRGQEPGAGRQRAPGSAGARVRRSAAHPPVPAQPGRQRDQVHAERRGRARSVLRRPPGRPRAGALRSARHRHRHRRRNRSTSCSSRSRRRTPRPRAASAARASACRSCASWSR